MTVRFGELLENLAHRRPDGAAVTFRGRTRTWAEVHRRCASAAAAFERLGLKPGERIAHLGFNSDTFFELCFAAPMARLEIVAMNFRWSPRECVAALEDAAPRALVFDAAHADIAREAAAACPSVRLLVQADGAAPERVLAYDGLAADGGRPASRGSGGDDTLIVCFTGGTTGRSKGAIISHANMMTNALGAPPIMHCEPERPQIIVGPMFHMAPGSRVYSSVLLNAHTIIMPEFDPGRMMELIERHRVHAVTMVPTMMHMLLEHPEFGRHDLSSLGPIMLGGSPTPSDLLERALAAFPGASFTNGYGMTETSNLIAALAPEHHVLEGSMSGKLRSVGRPVPYLDVRIFDSDDRETPRGGTGEIVVRGPTVMKGYLNRPDETAEAMRGGWFHTGDMGRFDADGLLHISGRAKEMIITGGENVYPAEVEDVLSMHPDVAQAAVIGMPDEKWGEEVHAVVIPTEGAKPDSDALIAHCRSRLAGYKRPRGVTFRTEPMPLTGTGKVRKLALRDALLAVRGEGRSS